MAKVTFLGLGVMGYPMAGNLRKRRRELLRCEKNDDGNGNGYDGDGSRN